MPDVGQMSDVKKQVIHAEQKFWDENMYQYRYILPWKGYSPAVDETSPDKVERTLGSEIRVSRDAVRS